MSFPKKIKSVDVKLGENGKVKAELTEVDFPTPAEDEVLIKVVVAGSNPKDWKMPVWGRHTGNTGDDVAGNIVALGSKVKTFNTFYVGQKVAGFHQMMTDYGAFAEYALVKWWTVFPLAEHISYEEGATLPLAVMTAFYALFDKLKLPTPLNPATEPIPLLIYGASSAVGAFAVKLAKLANIGPIIGVAGSGKDFAKSIGFDKIVDYRNGNVVADIKAALGGAKLYHALDAISEGESYAHVAEVMEPGSQSKATYVLYPSEEDLKPFSSRGIQTSQTAVGAAHSQDEKDGEYLRDFAYANYHLIGKWLAEGRFSAHPWEVIPGGLTGVQEGLTRLEEGKVSAKKLVFRIADTPGIQA